MSPFPKPCGGRRREGDPIRYCRRAMRSAADDATVIFHHRDDARSRRRRAVWPGADGPFKRAPLTGMLNGTEEGCAVWAELRPAELASHGAAQELAQTATVVAGHRDGVD